MAQVSKTRTYSTGGALTAENYNADRDEMISGINSITNAQISESAAIEESKILMSSTGHGHGGSTDGEKVKVTNLDVTGLSAGQVVKVNSGGTALEGGGAGRAFAWGVTGTLTVANEQGMKYICPQGMTVNKLWAKTTSGTCDIRIQRDTTDVGTLSVTSSVGSTTSFSSATLTAGEVITLDITAIASGVDVYVVMECTQS
jgi:hypothetical protein